MQARMTNPVQVLPDAMKALIALSRAAETGTVAATTHKLVHLRASQINGCGVCVDMHARELKEAGGRRVSPTGPAPFPTTSGTPRLTTTTRRNSPA